jgi:effector-binding domain-containing protein
MPSLQCRNQFNAVSQIYYAGNSIPFSNFTHMKKFVRFSLMLIAIVALLVLGLAIYEPNDVTVSRTTLIKAPSAAIIYQIARFSNWHKWSTLPGNDTSARITLEGTDGDAGSKLNWIGDDGTIGAGHFSITDVNDTMMRYTFNVVKPGTLIADGYISAIDTDDYTRVTWTFHKHFDFFENAVLVVFNLDKYMGGDFEKSLANLKKLIESEIEPFIEVKETNYQGGILAGIRDTVSWSDLTTFFGDTYSLFSKTPAEKITGPHAGVYYDWDTTAKRADVFAALHVSGSDIPVNGIIFSEIPQSKALTAVHKGGYASAGRVHAAISRKLAKLGQTSWMTIEEYIIYPGNEADSNKWVTHIYYLLQ